MIKKYHVHIYEVIKKMEVDTLAYNEIKAKEMALEAAKQGILTKRKSDCNLIAIEFELTDTKEEE